MISSDCSQIKEAVKELSLIIEKYCYDNQMKELFDLLLKWVFIKLWGGQPRMASMIELVALILLLAKRKKMNFEQIEVEMVIAILRQYLISLTDCKFSTSVYLILRCLRSISSIEVVVKIMLKQFQIDLICIHQHLKDRNDICRFYKTTLEQLIQKQLMKDFACKPESAFKTRMLQSNQYQLLQSKKFSQDKLVESIEKIKNSYDIKNLDTSVFQRPLQISTLVYQINRLFPPQNFAVDFFNVLFQEQSKLVTKSLVQYSKYILTSILKNVNAIIEARKAYSLDLVLSQIKLLQNAIKCQFIIQNIEELLGYTIGFVLAQMIFQDEHRVEISFELQSRNIVCKNDIFVKTFNRAMLRILQNANPQQVIRVLLDLWAGQSQIQPTPKKTIHLIISCLSRVSTEICNDYSSNFGKSFLIRSIEFLTKIQYDIQLFSIDITLKYRQKETFSDEDYAANQLKKIIISIHKAISSQILEVYQKAVQQSNIQDKYLGNLIRHLTFEQKESYLYPSSHFSTIKKQFSSNCMDSLEIAKQ